MMAEMPPGGGNTAPYPGPTYNPTPPPRRGIAFDRSYIFSLPGILTSLALLFSFCGLVSIEVFKSEFFSSYNFLSFNFWSGGSVFHEFTIVTSWLLLMSFTIVATLQIYRVISIRGRIMKFIMLGHSAFWALLTLISSAVLLSSWNSYWAVLSSSADPSVAAGRAAGAFGLLESFALMGVVGLLVLDMLNVLKTPLFED
ncbi:hypothetical protein BV898_08027 [Hypsibius exemplaris]|uniref:MARVEL domain-containing protein n=1 Tax=Hypsibius exemplaris TaxID=2072580 RepID=A0A1W0WRR0_HYPEX|nr:hypothetical protein BV898_08027 [Hypsibius exemplaris]